MIIDFYRKNQPCTTIFTVILSYVNVCGRYSEPPRVVGFCSIITLFGHLATSFTLTPHIYSLNPPLSPLLPHPSSLTPTPSLLLPHPYSSPPSSLIYYLTSHLLSYPSSPPSSIHPVPSSIILHNTESQTPLSLVSHPSCIIPSLTSNPLPHTSSPSLHLMSSLTQYPSSLNTQLSTLNSQPSSLTSHALSLSPHP